MKQGKTYPNGETLAEHEVPVLGTFRDEESTRDKDRTRYGEGKPEVSDVEESPED